MELADLYAGIDAGPAIESQFSAALMHQGGKTREPPGAKAPAARLCSSRVDWLLNPLPIWHKIISVVFHGLFQLLPAALVLLIRKIR
jgi:hypothetical protein